MMQPVSQEQQEYLDRTRRPLITIPTTRLGRVLFGMALVLWFVVLLLPCACFYLATSGQINIGHGSVPEPEIHPLLRINLIMEPDQRGLQLMRSVILPNSETSLCIETYISYALWQTDGSNSAVVYCDCYERTSADAVWTLTDSVYEACAQP